MDDNKIMVVLIVLATFSFALGYGAGTETLANNYCKTVGYTSGYAGGKWNTEIVCVNAVPLPTHPTAPDVDAEQ